MKQKPFIPSWLDDFGLSTAEMRVFIHLCRRADNSTGVAWPSYDTTMATCRLSRQSVWRSLKALEDQSLIVKIGKPFGGSCRYRILPIVPPDERMDASNSSNTGTVENPPIVPVGNSNRSSHGTTIVPPDEREGSPKKVLQRRKSIRPISSGGIEFAVWFKSLLPESFSLKANWQQSFGEAYDNLVTQKRDPDQIRQVCRWARTDSFWQTNFMSPAKLLKRNGDGITYFDVLTEKMKQPTGQTSKPVNLGRRAQYPQEQLELP